MTATLSGGAMLTGAKRIAPIAVLVFPFGLAFGAAATAAGLTPSSASLMSAAVFAGGSQFVALEFWLSPSALFPMLAAVLAVNARHLILGASLHPWLKTLPPGKKFAAVSVLTDTNWALAAQAQRAGERDVGLLVGSGIVLWVSWLAGTAAGAIGTSVLGEPDRYGIDAVMPAFFLVTLIDLWDGRKTALAWTAAGLTALLSVEFLPAGLHVLTGAMAGGVVGAIVDE